MWKSFKRKEDRKSISIVTDISSETETNLLGSVTAIDNNNTSKYKEAKKKQFKETCFNQDKEMKEEEEISTCKDDCDEPSITLLRELLSRNSSTDENKILPGTIIDQENNGILNETKNFIERNKEMEAKCLAELRELLFHHKKQKKDKTKFVQGKKDEQHMEIYAFRIPVSDHINSRYVDADNKVEENSQSDSDGQSKLSDSCQGNGQTATGTLILNESFLLQCLRARSYSVKEAFCVCLNFYDFRKSAQWSLGRIDSSALTLPLKSNVHWILPGYDYNHRRVLVLNAKYLDTRVTSIEKYQKMGQYLVEVLVNKDISTQFNGVTFVVDINGLPYRTLLSGIGIADVKRGTGMWRDAFPCKLKSILILGLNAFSRNFVNLCLKVASKKVQDRVKCLQNYDDLKKYIPQENLPPSLHGQNENFRWETYLKEFLPTTDGI